MLASIVTLAALLGGGWALTARKASAAPCVVLGFLEPTATDAKLQRVVRAARQHPRAERVSYVTAAERFEKLRKEHPELATTLDANPMESVIEVVARAPGDAEGLKRELVRSGAFSASIHTGCETEPR